MTAAEQTGQNLVDHILLADNEFRNFRQYSFMIQSEVFYAGDISRSFHVDSPGKTSEINTIWILRYCVRLWITHNTVYKINLKSLEIQ